MFYLLKIFISVLKEQNIPEVQILETYYIDFGQGLEYYGVSKLMLI